MTQGPRVPIILAWLLCAVLQACGSTGNTSLFVLPLDLPAGQEAVPDVRVASAGMDPDAAVLNLVNVKPWGTFEPSDLQNIEQSLRDTLALHARTGLSGGGGIEVHLMIRRYVVGLSNTAGAVLVSVAWAATRPGGTLVYHEHFYASDSVYLVGTIGLLKDDVHKAIVRRVATKSLALEAKPRAFPGTYDTLEEAVSVLPQTLVSMGIPGLAASPVSAAGLVGLLTPSGMSTVQWDVARPSQDFDWPGYLGKLYR